MPDADTQSRSNALILGGAVARGAFEVGALSVLAAEGVRFRRIVGTSAGALNAAVFGAGLAMGRAVHAAKVLEYLWLEHGAWQDFAHVSAEAWWHGQGAFDTSKGPRQRTAPPCTVYERPERFTAADLAEKSEWTRIAKSDSVAL